MSRIQRPLGSRNPPKGFSDSYSRKVVDRDGLELDISPARPVPIPTLNFHQEDEELPVLEPDLDSHIHAHTHTHAHAHIQPIPPRINLHFNSDIKDTQFQSGPTASAHQPPFQSPHPPLRSLKSIPSPHPPFHPRIRELHDTPNNLPSRFTRSPPLFTDSRASSLTQSQSGSAPVTICFVCNNRLKSTQDVVRTDYGSIHIHCFACSKCATSLIHSEFYYSSETQKLYCHLDYHQKFSPRCGLCKTPIENEGILALGKHWHSDHFFCHECSNPISSSASYFVFNGNTMCEQCHIEKTAIKCWKCHHPCSGEEEAIEALGRQWCSKCFSCENCNTPFPGYQFVLREDGILVCQECEYLKLKADCWK